MCVCVSVCVSMHVRVSVRAWCKEWEECLRQERVCGVHIAEVCLRFQMCCVSVCTVWVGACARARACARAHACARVRARARAHLSGEHVAETCCVVE